MINLDKHFELQSKNIGDKVGVGYLLIDGCCLGGLSLDYSLIN